MSSHSAGTGAADGTANSPNAGKPKGDAAKLADGARSAVSDYVATGAQAAKDIAEEGRAQMAGAVRGAADRIEGLSAAVRETSAKDLREALGDFAGKNPLSVFGLGVLTGVVLSRLLGGSDR